MVQKDKSIDADKFANSWLIFSSSLLVIFLVLYYTIKNDFWGGLIAFFISTFIVIVYCLFSSFKNKDKKKVWNLVYNFGVIIAESGELTPFVTHPIQVS